MRLYDRAFLGTALLSLLILTACHKTKNPTAPPDDGNGIPQGMARITGTVRDTNGQPVANAALHLVYDFSGPANAPQAPQSPMTPTVAILMDTAQTLYTECGGTTPIPDGAMVKLYWDRDSDGPDDTDPQPPLCNEPPDCPGGDPPFTVNFNEFPLNGADPNIALGAGRFYTDPPFCTIGDVLTPNIFYARVFCSDGHVLYTSDPVTLASGPGEYVLNFRPCTPCSGAPGIPEWHLDQPYPNPATDSVTVRFDLREAAHADLALIHPGGTHSDSLFSALAGSGPNYHTFRLRTLPNGLYTVRYRAGLYEANSTLLKNVTDPAVLRGTDGAVYSGNDGNFTVDAAASSTIAKRSARDEDQGAAVLSRLQVVAIRSGFQVADTTFAIVNQQTYSLNLVLRPE